ncbi:FHA domain-containing protein [Streptomyces sp. NRRL S-37]|uniref:FHA domain-containing protein n=1 Tax=Streptomyces sp. NRRL S-37 TaxID=1463903 RepID=UPI0004C7073E|nr:FHA domain-containing protein [Streptomyces sp. NRRL S-37]
MQIRLTVVDPLGPSSPARERAASCDVLVTAPAGTALAAVASALAAAVSGGDGSSGSPVLYAGDQRLDAQRCTLGEPPLIDGAVLAVGAPGEPEPHPELDEAPTRLHVVAGPDAGGVHLLHGGEIRIGRSADADVPLDDPDVSRLHCAVTVAPDGGVSVADLDSTNGTTLDGRRVGPRPVRLAPGALLRIGESALRLTPAAGPSARAATTPDGEGYVRVPGARGGEGAGASGHAGGSPGAADSARARAERTEPVSPPRARTHHTYGSAEWAASGDGAGHAPGVQDPPGPRTGRAPLVPGQGGAPDIEAEERATGRRAVRVVARGDVPRVPKGRRVSQPGPVGDETHAGSGSLDGGFGHGAVAPGHRPSDAAHGDSRDEAPAAGRHGEVPDRGSSRAADDAQYGRYADDARGGRHGGVPDRGLVRADDDVQDGWYADDARGGRHGEVPGRGPARTADDAQDGRRAGRGSASVAGDGLGGSGGGSRTDTPPRGTEVPQPPAGRKRGGIGAWARRLTGGRQEREAAGAWDGRREEPGGFTAGPAPFTPVLPETWPDPATLLLTALGPGPRLWERGPDHPEALAVRLGTADRPAPDGSGLLPAVPVTSGLREAGSLGLAGPRERLAGLARAVLAQLAALHSPDALEIVLIAADRSRPLAERTAEWSWLGWLPHVRPGHGQDCRLLLAHDHEQATARAGELLRRLADHAHAAPRISGGEGPYTVVVVDGDPGGPDAREAVTRLALEGPRAGIHVVCLAETAAASPASPVTETYEAACAAAPAFRRCGAVALLSGDVATALRLLRVTGTGPVGHGTLATVDAVSPAWAERFARALAPLRTDGTDGEGHAHVSAPLPRSARLLDELGLARATPASLMARWADAADDTRALGGRVTAVLGAGPRGPVTADLAADGPHLLVEGPPGSGRTELLRAVVASLAAAERPDRLAVVLVDGRGVPTTDDAPGEDLRVCTDVPHVTTHLCANDPVRMREFAQSLSAELKRRAELLGRSDFTEWHTGRELSDRMVAQRTAVASRAEQHNGDLDTPPSSTLRLRPGADRRRTEAAPPLPRLVVVVDDLDALVSPALGSPGRPAAGSVMRALEAVARDGERLGVHLVMATGPCARTAQSEPVRQASLRVALDAVVPGGGPEAPAPGRGRVVRPDGRETAFQGGRVTGRIPRTATLRPTVVPLEWHRMGDPPARRQVRELGNGPTDLALLASALERAARQVAAAEVPSLL